MAQDEIERFHEDDPDGWCEWHHPGRGAPGHFLMLCCGCDLAHEVEFQIVPNVDAPPSQRWPGEDGRYIIWRLRRHHEH